jgi:hypothetical protein
MATITDPDKESPMSDVRAIKRGNKLQISVTFEQAVLERLGAHAKDMGVSRPALISIAVTEYLNKKARSA